jgi:hypothetical protein
MEMRRRARGAAKHLSALYAQVDPDLHDMTNRAAARLGVSKAEFVNHILREVAMNQLSDDDVPTWWTLPLPEQEQLEALRAS